MDKVLSWWDIGVIIGYFLLITFSSIYVIIFALCNITLIFNITIDSFKEHGWK